MIFPDKFHTARLVLRPVMAADRDAIFVTYAQDAEVTRYLTWRPHRSRSDTGEYIAHCLATMATDTRTYVVTSREDGTVMGAFDLRRPAPHRLEFGYALGRAWWGQGLMTEALTEVVQWGLRRKRIFRIGSFCDVENAGSARVMEKAGLMREGLVRRFLIHPNISDEPRDCFSYARVR
jgi:[ribosomal protein S5]-alanine N-acetyltransferase